MTEPDAREIIDQGVGARTGAAEQGRSPEVSIDDPQPPRKRPHAETSAGYTTVGSDASDTTGQGGTTELKDTSGTGQATTHG